MTRQLFFFISFFPALCCMAQTGKKMELATIGKSLPGKGLRQHDFLYSGEWDYRKKVQTIYLVQNGKLIWTYDIPFTDAATGQMEELGDATMRPNGNIVFCRKTGASEVTPEKKIVWNYEAPKGTEIHSVQPIDSDRVLMVINGVPAKLLWIKTTTGEIEKELTVPTGKPAAHLQFRRVRLTDSGTLLAAHLDSNKVIEYNQNGVPIWSADVKNPWSVQRLKNGNTLIGCNRAQIVELNKEGQVVWEITQKDLPDIQLFITQTAVRLENGHTIFCNWCPVGIKDPNCWPSSIQLVEVTADKKVVWALRQWHDPDLGPASSIQLLDEPSIKKAKGYLHHYKN